MKYIVLDLSELESKRKELFCIKIYTPNSLRWRFVDLDSGEVWAIQDDSLIKVNDIDVIRR